MSYTSMCEYIIASSEAIVIKENIIGKEKCSFSYMMCSDAAEVAKNYKLKLILTIARNPKL
jgi:hypothetical protein